MKYLPNFRHVLRFFHLCCVVKKFGFSMNAEAVYIYREHLPANVFVMMRLGDGLSGVVCSPQSEGNVISSREGRLRFHGSLGWNASSAVLNDAQKHVS